MISSLLVAAFTLVSAEKSATVVIPENAEPSTRLSVEELTNYVSKITGVILKVKVAIETEGRNSQSEANGLRLGLQWNDKNSIVIGTEKTLGDNVPAAAKEALAKAKQYEAAWTGIVDGNLWIVGKETPGDLYATYHFIETKLGVRWFQPAYPEDPGDWYPIVKIEPCRGGEGQGLVVQDFQEFREPDFEYRSFGQMSSFVTIIAKRGWNWLIRNGFSPAIFNSGTWNTNATDAVSRHFQEYWPARCSPRRLELGGGHGIFHYPFPPNKYFKDHPEWFAMRDGKRVPGPGWQYCMSNKELLDRLLENTLAAYERTGGYGSFTFGYADEMHGYCECEACRALDGPHEGEHGPHCNVSSRILNIANRLTEPILAKYPNAKLKVFPYAAYREIPEKGGRYDRRCEQQYCTHGRCYGHAIDDPKCGRNASMWAHMAKWRAEVPRQFTYEYFTCTPPMYVCREKMEQVDLQAYKRAGMIGWYNEGSIPGSRFVDGIERHEEMLPSNWQWIYATGHLLWDTDLDLEQLLDDAEEKYYGVAYPAMRKYCKLRRELWNARPECMGYPNGDGRRPFVLMADGAKEQLLGLLEEAEKIVEVQSRSPRKEGGLHSSTSTLNFDSAVLRHRLSRDRKWLTKYWIEPNEKARAMAADRLTIPFVKGSFTIDGKADEADWQKALDVPWRLFRRQSEHASLHKEPAPEMKIAYRVATDGKALYFHIDAREDKLDALRCTAVKYDDGAWGDDGVEIMIFPPSVENVFYHLAINANGVVYDSRCPGENKDYNLGIEAKAGRTPTGWTLEIRVPADKIHPIVAGEQWRMQFARNRYAGKRMADGVALGGFLPHETAEYRTFEFGK